MPLSDRAHGGRRGAVSAIALVSLVAGCGGSASAPASSTSAGPTSPAPPTSSPTVVITGGGSGTLWPIKHVVFLIKENRTFDNLFGTFPGANGVTVGMDHGTRRPLTRGTDGRVPGD